MQQRFELMLPGDLAEVLRECPIAYIPMGTLEFHGWHMPFGFDSIKAHSLCMMLCDKNGGVVLPPTYFGFEGAHHSYKGSIISQEEHVRANLELTTERLIEMGFKVLVILTGHYPNQQMDLVGEVAKAVMEKHPGVQAIGLAEPQVVENEWKGDHAAKWETSIAMCLIPELVKMENFEQHKDPMYGIYGEDPRDSASEELGQETIDEFIELMSDKIQKMTMAVSND